MDAVLDQIPDIIARAGWAVAVTPMNDTDGWYGYTIGLTGLDLPELSLIGPDRGQVHAELDQLAAAQRDTVAAWKTGAAVRTRGGEFEVADMTDQRKGLAARHYGRPVPVRLIRRSSQPHR